MEDLQQVENDFKSDEKYIEKLKQETLYLTNNSTFFPDLVWKYVVSKLKATKDIESCSISSPYFGKILKKKRESRVVLPKAFEFLGRYLIEKEEEEHEETDFDDGALVYRAEIAYIENEFRDLEPREVGDVENLEIGNENLAGRNQQEEMEFINDNHPLKELFNCRLVSKSWNSAIEALFQHKEVGHFTLKFDMSGLKYLRLDPCCHDTFMPSLPPQVFMERFDPTHYNFVENKSIKNPFIGRSVKFIQVQIYRDQEDEYIHYLDGILELLTKYGSEIWYICFDFYNYLFGNDPVVLYERLQDYLSLLPNLKILRVTYRGIHPPNADLLQNDVMRTYVFGLLEEKVNLNPIPTLPKLEFMSLSNLPTPIFNALIVRNRHIAQLQVDRKAYHGDYDLFRQPFPNLTALSIKFSSVDQFEMFENCHFPMQLEKVYLWYYGSAPFIAWCRIFNAMESKFGDSCKELLLQMPLPKTEEEKLQVLEDSHICRLNFKRLERITVFDDTPFCLDFLLPSKITLDQIFLRYSNDDNENTVAQHLENQKFDGCQQTIEFLGFKEKMGDSNIWMTFLNLSELTINRSQEMGDCVTYTASWTHNQGIGYRWVNGQVWSRETGQDIN